MTDTFTSLGAAAHRVVRGLTEKQRAARKGKLTGSRISVLMTGDTEGIHQLWRQMVLDEPEPDLSWVLPVQIGLATEEVNLRFAERKLREQIIDRGVFIQHPMFEWAGATIDGMLRESERIIECKHVGGREPIEKIIERYYPQIIWQMECASWKPKEAALSILIGNNDHLIELIPFDTDYAGELISRAQQFLCHVRDRTPPVELPPVQPPVIPSKKYDMQGNNAWGSNAGIWSTTRQAAKDFAAAEKELRSLVPADAKEASGYGVSAKRDRAGRITLREQT